MENLPKDYENLLKIHLSVQREYDTTLQTLHENRKQLQIAEALHLDYQEEIKTLQKDQKQWLNVEEKLQKITREKSALQEEIGENLRNYQHEIGEKDGQIEALRREIEAQSKINQAKDQSNETENSECRRELITEVEELRNRVEDFQVIVEESKAKNAQLQLQNSNWKSELETYQECLKSKSEMLTEANDLVETLQNENVALQFELDKLKSLPLNDKESKGNSLFAEVNDRRVQLEQKYQLMKRKFDEMKRERGGHLQKIRELRCQNLALCEKLEAEVKAKNDEADNVKAECKDEISVLKDCIKSYKCQLEESCNINLNRDDYTYFDRMIKKKNDEIEEWREKTRMRSLNNNLMSHDLSEAKRHVRHLQTVIEQLKIENDKLKQENVTLTEELSSIKERAETNKENRNKKASTSPVATKTITSNEPKSILKTAVNYNCPSDNFSVLQETVIDYDEVEPSKVKFSEDAKKADSVTSFRRGAKILIAKPVRVSYSNH